MHEARGWNAKKLGVTVTADMCDLILSSIKIKQTNEIDKPWWLGSDSQNSLQG